jgi:predicted GNAT family acetyltransferase
MRKRFTEGLRIKLPYAKGQKRAAGFIEYVPGENAWRAVSAPGHMFIHCLSVYPTRTRGQGVGSRLIGECLEDAKAAGLRGIAVLASSGPFMAGSDLFLKNGFRVVDTSGDDVLLSREWKRGPLPCFNDRKKQRARHTGLTIVHTGQCPWVSRFVEQVRNSDLPRHLRLTIRELKTPAQAQRAPTLYATFSLLHNGRVLADRYISMTRFRNILREQHLL